MKNIHTLPTDKPSRLHYFTANKAGYYLYPNNGLIIPRNPNCINQNTYITSDEEIKDSWVLNTHTNEVYFLQDYYGTQPIIKKIILTTDQDLIENGVQAIDDEFLEWFIKNPSCESIRITYENDTDLQGYDFNYYKIIIPQEEPKQELPIINGSYGCTIETNRKETLEEAAAKYVKTKWEPAQEENRESFIDGAKWQQTQDKNKFSDEEVLELLLNCPGPYLTDDEIKEWFGRNKKNNG